MLGNGDTRRAFSGGWILVSVGSDRRRSNKVGWNRFAQGTLCEDSKCSMAPTRRTGARCLGIPAYWDFVVSPLTPLSGGY